jgi:hypothetical protein
MRDVCRGLIVISLTNKASCLHKKRLIRGLLVGFIISPSKPNRSLVLVELIGTP